MSYVSKRGELGQQLLAKQRRDLVPVRSAYDYLCIGAAHLSKEADRNYNKKLIPKGHKGKVQIMQDGVGSLTLPSGAHNVPQAFAFPKDVALKKGLECVESQTSNGGRVSDFREKAGMRVDIEPLLDTERRTPMLHPERGILGVDKPYF